jgi:hypothetical protein
MKPGEFDELFRQKFEQNDFAYNARNWDALSEQLDGRAKKRSMIMWLWLPASGMAASVALALGVTSMLNFGLPNTQNNSESYAHIGKFIEKNSTKNPVAMIPYTSPISISQESNKVSKTNNKRTTKQNEKYSGNNIGIKLQNVASNNYAVNSKNATGKGNAETTIYPASTIPDIAITPKTEKKEIAAKQVMRTFKQDIATTKKPLNLSVILSGGINQGNQNSGYMAGATVRKMINDKVYVESDVAFATSANSQRTLYMSYDNPGITSANGGQGSFASKPTAASKTTNIESGTIAPDNSPIGVLKTQDISYNLYYAQITPGIGYKVMKRMSIGMGPDFQKMLVDNRPATSDVDRGNLQVAPSFDVGFVGKTEYALTQRVKAAISYRKGINGVINPSDKFIDRDYVQFQMRCTIFNR